MKKESVNTFINKKSTRESVKEIVVYEYGDYQEYYLRYNEEEGVYELYDKNDNFRFISNQHLINYVLLSTILEVYDYGEVVTLQVAFKKAGRR